MRFLIQAIKIGAIVVIAALALIGTRAAFSYAKENTQGNIGEPVRIEVTQDETVAAIGKDLQANGLISNVETFRFYVFVNQKAKYFEAGSYPLQRGMTMGQIVSRLAGSETPAAPAAAPGAEVNVRIPDGTRIEQIPAILREAGLGPAATDFLNVAKTGTWNYDFLKDRPQGASLEGYLFADTYRFSTTADATTVIKGMLDNFQKKWETAINSQPPDKRGKPPAGAQNLYQTLILASIIEREAGSDSDRGDIASVYYNRLRSQPPLPLQADPTTQYAVGNEGRWWKKDLTQADLDTANPYNTYPNPQNKGGSLPPTPICSPSLKSLQAALNPNSTDFLFFVAKNDGSGTHAFARTNQEQEDNKKKYLKP